MSSRMRCSRVCWISMMRAAPWATVATPKHIASNVCILAVRNPNLAVPNVETTASWYLDAVQYWMPRKCSSAIVADAGAQVRWWRRHFDIELVSNPHRSPIPSPVQPQPQALTISSKQKESKRYKKSKREQRETATVIRNPSKARQVPNSSPV